MAPVVEVMDDRGNLDSAVTDLRTILDEAIEKFYMWNMTNMESLRHTTDIYVWNMTNMGPFRDTTDIRKISEAVTGWLKAIVQERQQTLQSLEDKSTRNMAELALIEKTLPLLERISSLVKNGQTISVQLDDSELKVRMMLTELKTLYKPQ
jgi:hypothetical protein